MKSAAQLVDEYANAVIEQELTVSAGDVRAVRKHGGRLTRSWQQIERLGETGLEESCRLLQHPHDLVRIEAAVLLRNHAPERAKTVLQELAVNDGRAQQALDSWESANWD